MPRSSTRHSLSSISTFFFKFIFPAIWIGSLGIGVIKSLLSEPQEKGNWFILAFLFVFIIFYWNLFRIKSVEIDNRYLYVSNYIKTIRVPFSQIEDVTELFLNPRPIRITFKKVTEFGIEIVFVPYVDFQGWFSGSHPAVAKLRELAGLIKY